MNKKIFALGILLIAALCTVQASYWTENPRWKKILWAPAEVWYEVPAKWSIVAADKYMNGYIGEAIKQAKPEIAPNEKYTVILGVRGDKEVKKYKKFIPKQAEGYYLKVSQEGIVIAGNDERGLFYGIQSLLQHIANDIYEEVAVADWPDMPFRGTVEGFYGTPWSHEARLSQLDFYGKNKMNVYIYGPKDDPWHRDKWRVPYPEAEANRIAELVEVAKKNYVNFYWAIHPGVDIKWNNEDRDALVAKLEKMYDLGVRAFAVFFDDIWGEGTKADKQAELLNYVDNNFIQKKKDVAPLIMCPTEYNRGWANEEKGYLRTLGSTLNKGIEIMWTGNSVVACIDKPTMEWINERIQRKAYIWLNFPVNDFVRDHMLMGPLYGNGKDIAPLVSGFVSNPMEYAETSKISLYGIADYCWNTENYDEHSNWQKSLQNILPSNSMALGVFALYNKDLGPNGHGFRREEGDEIKDIAQKAIEGDDAALDILAFKCWELDEACDKLLADNSNPQLIHELRPWLLQGKLLADYGTTICNMKKVADGKISPSNMPLGIIDYFNHLWNQARDIRKQMYDNENNKAMLHPYQTGTKLGTKVLLPTLNNLFTLATEKYNKEHNSKYDTAADYNPFKVKSTVKQLALLPVSVRGSDVTVASALEVINWQAGGEFVVESDRPITFQGMDFNFGVNGVAKNFKLELLVDGNWREVSLLHYADNDPVIHTGNELGGMTASALRITNISGAEQQVYFKDFKFVRR
ncbi:MAG: beta-N-acetylglucosaminidase domain-containing protein [Bacteroidaceae bacterium]|nr:beta-N-acetylglucosaminidase domain-containing protein [Bacteroidaceae bacterium]